MHIFLFESKITFFAGKLSTGQIDRPFSLVLESSRRLPWLVEENRGVSYIGFRGKSIGDVHRSDKKVHIALNKVNVKIPVVIYSK